MACTREQGPAPDAQAAAATSAFRSGPAGTLNPFSNDFPARGPRFLRGPLRATAVTMSRKQSLGQGQRGSCAGPDHGLISLLSTSLLELFLESPLPTSDSELENKREPIRDH